MADAVPEVLRRLLTARDSKARDAAWAAFVSRHSRLIFHAARKLGGDYDAIMDRYAYVLEQLRVDDARRLRQFVADGRSALSTWLVVVSQRLCFDYHRQCHGRNRSRAGESPRRDDAWLARRRLVALLGAEVDLAAITDARPSISDSLQLAEIYDVLEAALQSLQPQDRLLVKLRFEDDLPIPEIARNLGFASRFHVYRHLDRVLRELRRVLESSGVREMIP